MPVRREAAATSPGTEEIHAWLGDARRVGRTALREPLAKRVLAAYGLQVPRGVYVEWRDGGEQALRQTPQVLRELEPPFVLKVVAPGVVHKSEFGGVQLGLRAVHEVQDAMRRMAGRLQAEALALEGFLIEETAPRGHELVIGGFRDESFGPIVMVGIGGIYVEVLQDVAFRICPITRRDAEDMLAELKGASLLKGARGGQSIDPSAACDALLAVGGERGLLMTLSAELAELDINPLIVGPSGAVAADARIVPSAILPPGTPPARPREPARLEALFAPRRIAVVGASSKGAAQGNTFIRCLRTAGFEGAIYPIHPVEQELEGLPAFRDLASTPEPVDYAFVAIAAPLVPALLAGARGRVRVAQVMASGFDADIGAESPLDGRTVPLPEALRQAIEVGGMRLLGPNCMGTHSPRGRMSFVDEGVGTPGCVGILSQSGGLSIDMIRRGRHRGLGFSGVVSIGNCLDLDPCDLLEHFLDDPHTHVVGVYVEHVRDGRRFVQLLRRAEARKPVVILKGGRSAQGQRAAASHTGSLVSNDKVWGALARQTGTILVDDLDQFIDALAAFQAVAVARTLHGVADEAEARQPREESDSQVIMFGNGGGASVLAADALARRGILVSPLRAPTADALQALRVPAGASLDNPIDVPANVLQRENGALVERILQTVCRHETPQALVVHLNLPVILGYRHVDMLGDIVRAVIRIRHDLSWRVPLFLVLRSSGESKYEEQRLQWAAEASRAGIAVVGDLPAAAQALAAVLEHQRFRTALAAVGSRTEPEKLRD